MKPFRNPPFGIKGSTNQAKEGNDMAREMSSKEECLYCHGNLTFAGVCSVCGEVRPPEVRKTETPPAPKPEFHSGKLLEVIISGV
jgi:hypothetical protein